METSAILRGVRLSAQKGRLVADQIRGLPVDKALSILSFSPKKGAVIIKKVLAQLGWKAQDVDLYEVNEAFAAVSMAAMHDVGIDHARINVNGGACALGHPVGATGARILTTLLYALRKRGGKRGIAALCLGGGEAVAVAVELV